MSVLNAGNSFCCHCFSNIHLKCSIVRSGWRYCLNGIFSVPSALRARIFQQLDAFFFQMQLKQ